MPDPRVVEMRRRLVTLMRLADGAERRGRGRKASMVLSLLDGGVITYREAVSLLRRLALDR